MALTNRKTEDSARDAEIPVKIPDLDSPLKLSSRLTSKYLIEKRTFLSTSFYILKIV
jgi:hypothetical protein